MTDQFVDENALLRTEPMRLRKSMIHQFRVENEKVREEDEASLQTERVFEEDFDTARELQLEKITVKDIALNHEEESKEDTSKVHFEPISQPHTPIKNLKEKEILKQNEGQKQLQRVQISNLNN